MSEHLGVEENKIERQLQRIEHDLQQLKVEYERYFLGQTPREPGPLRLSVKKQLLSGSQTPIRNTAARFKFNALRDRFQVFVRQWDKTQREIEAGTYTRHLFKAQMRAPQPKPKSFPSPAGSIDLFSQYQAALRSCGQSPETLNAAQFKTALAQYENKLRGQYGDAEIQFEIVINQGRAKLKAKRITG
ncbi:MAG: hypothetical protein CL917_13370 [Deltaproteobacteria bacterium]|nr:hypothetical protein [Deltaproteobacteria bacterium]